MKGRPVLGAIAGLLFGVFGALELLIFKVVASDSILLLVVPLVGLLLGLVLGLTTPLAGSRAISSDRPTDDDAASAGSVG